MPDHIIPVNADKDTLNLYSKIRDKCELLDIYLKISEDFRIPKKCKSEIGDEHILKQYQFSRYSPITKGSSISKKDRRKIIADDSRRYINCTKRKIVLAEDALRIEATIDESKSICQGGVYFAVFSSDTNENPTLDYLMAVLNSKLLTTIYKTLFSGMHMGGGYLRFRTNFLKQLPIRTIDFSNPDEKAKHDKLVALVENMLELQKKYCKTRKDRDKELYERQIRIVDAQIDGLVYELYGLTDEEVKIIERA